MSLGDPRLVEAADRNLVDAFAALVPNVNAGRIVRQFGAVTSVVTGVAHPFYNPVFVLDDHAMPRDVTAAVEGARAMGHEPCVLEREDVDRRFGALVRSLGFEPDEWITPGMVLDPVPDRTPAPPEGLRIELVREGPGGSAGLEAFHVAFGSGPVFRSALPESTLRDDRFRLIVGWDADGPATCSIAVRSAREFGVYAVGTVEHARRRGYGTAITWAALAVGRDAWGLSTAVLQSSELGLGVYSKMGFVEVCRYIDFFAPTPEASASIQE